VLYFNQKNISKAKETYFLALKTYEKVFGNNHPDVAKSCVNIADFFKFQKNTQEALSYYQRALSIYAERFGKDHNLTIQTQQKITKLGRQSS